MTKNPAEIFKAYDIRGVVGKTLTPNIVEALGQAIGSEALARGQTEIAIGRDGRLSGPELSRALTAGLLGSGVNVIDIGMVATPMLYFATFYLQTQSGAMLTGSHNPPDYNGLKIVLGGETLFGDAIQALRLRLESNDLAIGKGSIRTEEVKKAYISRITRDVKLVRPMSITIDCGNGVAGTVAGELYRTLGCKVHELFCEVDGNFPSHHPDPCKPENLTHLIHALATNDSELGLAFDGDGDRLGVVTKDGEIVFSDRQLMLFAQDLLTRHPGAEIIYDVKSTRNLAPWVKQHGGKPTLWKTGHSLIKAKMKETGALLAGEMSGHLFLKERWYGFDDGLYNGARLLELLSKHADANAVLKSLPNSFNTPELHMKVQEGEQYSIITKLQKNARFKDATNVVMIDGVRAEYKDGFGLARASNTTPVIILRFEADTNNGLKRIQSVFRDELLEVAPELTLPY